MHVVGALLTERRCGVVGQTGTPSADAVVCADDVGAHVNYIPLLSLDSVYVSRGRRRGPSDAAATGPPRPHTQTQFRCSTAPITAPTCTLVCFLCCACHPPRPLQLSSGRCHPTAVCCLQHPNQSPSTFSSQHQQQQHNGTNSTSSHCHHCSRSSACWQVEAAPHCTQVTAGRSAPLCAVWWRLNKQLARDTGCFCWWWW